MSDTWFDSLRLRRPIDLLRYVSALGRPTEPVHYDENDTDLVKNSFQKPLEAVL